jgi:hypothetical protein
MSRLPQFATLLLWSCTAWAQSQTPRFLVETAGQNTYDSCQSYSAAAAFAFKRDARFPISTAHELRAVEADLRARILAYAPKGADGNPSVRHEDIVRAFSDLTGGAYALRKYEYPDLPALGNAISARTGVTSADMLGPNFLLGAAVKDVLLVSVTRLGNNRYREGHLVTLLGVDGAANSSRRYLILNSAVKVGKERSRMCRDGLPDSPGPYEGMVSWVKSEDIEFKSHAGALLAWRVQAK